MLVNCFVHDCGSKSILWYFLIFLEYDFELDKYLKVENTNVNKKNNVKINSLLYLTICTLKILFSNHVEHTVHPYFSAIPCSVSVFPSSWRTRWPLFRTWLHVLPYRFGERPESQMDSFSAAKSDSSSMSITIVWICCRAKRSRMSRLARSRECVGYRGVWTI